MGRSRRVVHLLLGIIVALLLCGATVARQLQCTHCDALRATKVNREKEKERERERPRERESEKERKEREERERESV